MKIPHPIPYQGSKRWLARTLCSCLPADTQTLYEPFAGSAAVTLAAASVRLAQRYVIGEIHDPLVNLWKEIINHPEHIAREYEALWHAQKGREREFYDDVRDRFNRSHDPGAFLYLLARCVKAAIRYNASGEFNNSPDNRRCGANPETMRWHVFRASKVLRCKCRVRCADFRETIAEASPEDVIYMDPPYQGVCKDRDARYVRGVGFDEFCEALQEMNRKELSFIISYDGRTGDRRHGALLPEHLDLLHREIPAGRSTQETLLGRKSVTFESLYFSSPLMARLGQLPGTLLRQHGSGERQLELFEARE